MVLFIIGCFEGTNSGAGGHYYSLINIARAMNMPCKIIVVGDRLPQAFKADEANLVIATRRNILEVNLHNLVDLKIVKLVHTYDIAVSILGSKIASELSVPHVHTKAGGRPSGFWSIAFTNQIVIQQSDYDDLARRKIFKPKRLCLIPNRVTAPDRNSDRVSPFLESHDSAIKLLRIARIGKDYHHSILQAINLTERLRRDLGSAYLAIVGKVEDDEILKDIKSQIGNRDYVKILTEDVFTKNAAELIDFTDIVIGTGRGFIEGMAYGKVLFFPVKDDQLPCLLNQRNYQEAFFHNFSQRISRSANIDGERALNEFLSAYRAKNLEQYSNMATHYFERDHLVSSGVKNLQNFYSNEALIESKLDFYKKFLHFQMLGLANRTLRKLPIIKMLIRLARREKKDPSAHRVAAKA